MENSTIGKLCKKYRVEYITPNLAEFSRLIDTPYKNIHAFENGRASSLSYPFLYFNVLPLDIKVLFLLDYFMIGGKTDE